MDAYKNRFDLFIQKRQFNFIAPVLVLIFLFITNSALLASTLGVSVGAAAKIAWSAYGAYKAGSSIKNAIAPFLGWGALAWFAADIIIGWGAAQLISSAPLQNL